MGSGAGFSLSPIEKTPNIKILVGASDIDADVVRGTIRGLDGNCISQMLAGCQCLNLKVVVVQGVRPVPIRIDRQRAKISLERIGVVVSNEARNLSCIGVRNGKRTSVGQMKVLSYRSAIVASNNSEIVHTVDAECDSRSAQRAIAHLNCVSEAVGCPPDALNRTLGVVAANERVKARRRRVSKNTILKRNRPTLIGSYGQQMFGAKPVERLGGPALIICEEVCDANGQSGVFVADQKSGRNVVAVVVSLREL